MAHQCATLCYIESNQAHTGEEKWTIEARENEAKAAIRSGNYALAGHDSKRDQRLAMVARRPGCQSAEDFGSPDVRRRSTPRLRPKEDEPSELVVADFFGGLDSAAASQNRAARSLDRIEAGLGCEGSPRQSWIQSGRSREKAAADNAAWDFYHGTDGEACKMG